MFDSEFLYKNTKIDKNKLKEEWIRKNFPNLYEDVILFSKNINFTYCKFSQILYHYKHNKLELPICDNCKKENNRFIGFEDGYKLGCNRSCAISLTRKKSNETRKLNTLKKYGVEHTTQLESVKNKMKKTNVERYGCEYASQNESIKETIKETNNIRYGVNSPLQNTEIKNKMITDFTKKYGVSNPSKLPEVIKKVKENNIKKYGSEWHISSITIKEKIKQSQYSHNYNNLIINYGDIKELEILSYNNNIVKFLCKDCYKEFEVTQTFLYNRHIRDKSKICINCNPLNNKISNGQNEIIDFLKEIEIKNIEVNHRKVIKPYEIDIYLPDYKLGIEFNGIFWHSELCKVDKKYHYNKLKMSNDKNIELIQIWEDDWKYKKQLIKSIIKNKLKRNDISIGARKCIIKTVSNEDTRIFLNENHIQGWCVSKWRYGLYYNNELVSLITFSKGRKNVNSNSFELVRFCNKINTNVIGSLSKLWKHFIKEISPSEIISYCDNDLFNGDSYLKVGMKLDSISYNYWWCDGNIKYNRWNFRKDKLIKDGYDKNKTEFEIMISRGWYRIYGSGNKKYVIKL